MSRSRERSDGVRIVARPGIRKSVWLIAGALALVALAALVLVRAVRPLANAPPPPPAPELTVAAAAPEPEREPAPDATVRRAHPIARPQPAVPAEPETPPGPAVAPPHEDAPVGFGKPGEKSGIGLFPPPGTKPIKIGIVVPDDFPLPAGYVRHYQATEDGALLPPILLFHPDYEWVDDAGKPIALPADRVVPPELAPPGLPIRMLEVPNGGGSGR